MRRFFEALGLGGGKAAEPAPDEKSEPGIGDQAIPEGEVEGELLQFFRDLINQEIEIKRVRGSTGKLAVQRWIVGAVEGNPPRVYLRRGENNILRNSPEVVRDWMLAARKDQELVDLFEGIIGGGNKEISIQRPGFPVAEPWNVLQVSPVGDGGGERVMVLLVREKPGGQRESMTVAAEELKKWMDDAA